MTTDRFPDWKGTFLIGRQAKFTQISDLLVIATQICLVLTRKHMTAQISSEYSKKKQKGDNKYENYTDSYLQAHKLHKKDVKTGKKVKKAENSPAPLFWAKTNLSSNT